MVQSDCFNLLPEIPVIGQSGTSQETTSDGYATGLIPFVLQQAGILREDSKLNRGLGWPREDGRFVATYSLTHRTVVDARP